MLIGRLQLNKSATQNATRGNKLAVDNAGLAFVAIDKTVYVIPVAQAIMEAHKYDATERLPPAQFNANIFAKFSDDVSQLATSNDGAYLCVSTTSSVCIFRTNHREAVSTLSLSPSFVEWAPR